MRRILLLAFCVSLAWGIVGGIHGTPATAGPPEGPCCGTGGGK